MSISQSVCDGFSMHCCWRINEDECYVYSLTDRSEIALKSLINLGKPKDFRSWLQIIINCVWALKEKSGAVFMSTGWPPLGTVFSNMITKEKNGSTFKKWSRFPKQLQGGAILAPLFFSVSEIIIIDHIDLLASACPSISLSVCAFQFELVWSPARTTFLAPMLEHMGTPKWISLSKSL